MLDVIQAKVGVVSCAGEELAEVLEHVGSGRLMPVVDRVLPLEDVAAAHRHLESRAGFGKTVLPT